VFDKSEADAAFTRGKYELAARLYHEGARDGDAYASQSYAYCLMHGFGVARDVLEAKSFYAFARNLEGGEASYNLAMIYLHGIGRAKNFAKAYECMKDSANLGCIEAQLYLGMAYTSGCMFEPDVIEIETIPAHKPVYRRYDRLLEGEFFYDEDEEAARYAAIKQDARSAFLWFQTAARHDSTYVEELSAKGKYLYAKCYADGLGTDFDRERTARLMLLAGAAGSPEALDYIAEHGITYETVLADVKLRQLSSGKKGGWYGKNHRG